MMTQFEKSLEATLLKEEALQPELEEGSKPKTSDNGTSSPLGLKLLPAKGFYAADRAIIMRIQSAGPHRIRVVSREIEIKNNKTKEDVMLEITNYLNTPNTLWHEGAFGQYISTGRKTRLDANLSSKIHGKEKTPCYFVVELSDRMATFMQGKNIAVEGDYAPVSLIGDEENTPLELLHRAFYLQVDNEGEAQSVMSYCEFKSDCENKYSIGLRISESPPAGITTNIIIDPKVRNDG